MDEAFGARCDGERGASASGTGRVNGQRKGESFSRLRIAALERWLAECEECAFAELGP